MSEATSTRLYIRDAQHQRWHEVAKSGANYVTTFCGLEYRDKYFPMKAPVYDKRTSWPPHGVPRCKTCVNKALRSR